METGRFGYFGVLPRRRGFVGQGLPQPFTDRFDRWFALASAVSAPEPADAIPVVWRFAARAGLFAAEPCSGVWQLCRNADGARYPFVVARLCPQPDASDRWFEGAARIVEAACDGDLRASGIMAEIAALGDPAPAMAEPEAAEPEAAILMWRDDWEVHELSFATGQALAAYGLPGDG